MNSLILYEKLRRKFTAKPQDDKFTAEEGGYKKSDEITKIEH